MIGSRDCYEIWAPRGSSWTEWAKPVVFASVPGLSTEAPVFPSPLDAPGLPEAREHAAVIVDLPGAESVTVGLALAKRGFRPVPLFNGTHGPSPVVDILGLVDALGAGSQVLRGITIGRDAPPAFLIDARRKGTTGPPAEGSYDNRWVILPQDLPSATLLRSRGIREVTLIVSEMTAPAEDLAHVLRRWQEEGLRLRLVDLTAGKIEENLTVTAPRFFRRLWYAALATMGLHRSDVGGFGSPVPSESHRAGYFG